MRIRAFVFPVWMNVVNYAGSGELTPFPVTIPLREWVRAFWGTNKWRLSGTLKYRTTDGTSWSAWQNYDFDIAMDLATPGRYIGNENLIVGDSGDVSGQYYGPDGVGSPDAYAYLRWKDMITGGPNPADLQWSGNHGGIAGNVAPALQINGAFDQAALGTNADIVFNTAHDESGFLNADVEGFTILGSTVRVYVNSQSDVSVAGNTEVESIEAELQQWEYLEYAQAGGANPVWDAVTGAQLLNPLTAPVP